MDTGKRFVVDFWSVCFCEFLCVCLRHFCYMFASAVAKQSIVFAPVCPCVCVFVSVQ